MKRIIAAIALTFFSFCAFGASYDMKTGDELVGDRCAPGDVIYYGVTEKGTKDVVICQDGETITYGFGNILKNWSGKDLVLDVQASTVIQKNIDDNKQSTEIIIVKNKTHAYAITHTVHLPSGVETNYLSVHDLKNNNKAIAEIKLDNDFIVNHIRDNFVQ